MKGMLIVSAIASQPNSSFTGRWKVSIPVVLGSQPIITKNFDGSVSNLPSGWTARVVNNSTNDVRAQSDILPMVALVLVAPYAELMKVKGSYETVAFFEGGPSGYSTTMQSLLWGYGNMWVYPEWLANSADPKPLNPYLVETAGMWQPEVLMGRYGDGAQVQHWGLFRRDVTAEFRAGNLAWGSVVPTVEHTAEVGSPIFVPTSASRVYDNTQAVVIPIAPVVAPAIVPVVGTAASAADAAAMETRLIAIQASIGQIAQAIRTLPTSASLNNAMAATRNDLAAVNGSISALGDYAVATTVPRTTRMAETALVAAAVSLLTK